MRSLFNDRVGCRGLLTRRRSVPMGTLPIGAYSEVVRRLKT